MNSLLASINFNLNIATKSIAGLNDFICLQRLKELTGVTHLNESQP